MNTLHLGFSLKQLLLSYLAMVTANNEIDNNKKYTSNAGSFDCHAHAAVQCRAHRPMKHILGFKKEPMDAAIG